MVCFVDGQDFLIFCEHERVTEPEYIGQIIYKDAEQQGPQK